MSQEAVSSLKSLDEQQLNRFHARMVLTAGMGFFTDAYDLFIIGVVTAILAPLWGLTTTQLSVLNAAALGSAALGAVFFGWMSDRFGRKKMYGFEILVLFFGSILSALSASFTWLLVSRIIVGIGVGGDYPTSAAVTSESANRKNRGLLVLLVFGMQALGLIVGPLLASLLMAVHIPHAVLWRILLAIGAIPAASVFILRRRISESPRYLLTQKAPVEVSRSVSYFAGRKSRSYDEHYTQRLWKRPWIKYLVGTAGAWFLLDVAFYGNGISSVLIMKTISPHMDLLMHTLMSGLLFLVFAVPGYILAAISVDRIGRKNLQICGFLIIGICYTFIALIPHISQQLVWFIIIFGLSFFFVNFGPNTTTFLIPSEIYPTAIRARAHGISAAVGKAGAFVGAFILPTFLHVHGLAFTIALMSYVALAGALITLLVPEMKHVSLDDIEKM